MANSVITFCQLSLSISKDKFSDFFLPTGNILDRKHNDNFHFTLYSPSAFSLLELTFNGKKF